MKSPSLVLVLWSLPALAGAPVVLPPVAEARGDLDGDGRPERVHLEADGSLRVDDDTGRELGRLALGAATGGTLAVVTVEDHAVVEAQAALGRGRMAAAVLRLDGGKLETIYSGVIGPSGDGERSERLRVDEAGVVRYQTAPTVQRCDGADMLFPERWDFAGHRFRPVESEVPDARPLGSTRTPPPDLLPEPLGLFHFTAASTSPDADRHADRLGAPRELEDGRADTVWVAGPAGGGRGAWVTARAPSAEHRLRAVRLTPGAGAPRALVILVGRDAFSVTLSGAAPQWVPLPALPPTGCLSLIVAEPHGSGADTSLAEVALFTDLDVAGGIEQLVEMVASERSGAAGAEQVLAGRGADAVRAIGNRLATGLPAAGGGRRRLLGVLAALKLPDAAPLLGRALETARSDERGVIVDGLALLGAAGASEALRLFRDGAQASEARADAARVLGAVGGEDNVQALVDGAGAPEPALRVAILHALEAAHLTAPIARALAEPAVACDARSGILARALGKLAGAEAGGTLAALWSRCRASADFPLKLRLVRAAADAAAMAILSEAAHDSEPVLRQIAVEGRASLAPAALDDADPSVRRAALGALDPAQSAPVEKVLAADRWPLVRRAAAEALGRRCGESAKTGLTVALAHDPAEEVRRESLVSLGRCGPVPLALLAGTLKSGAQPVAVRELAAALVAKQGEAGAGPLLADTVDEVLSDPAADERSASLAVACLRALGRLHDGSRRVLEALGAASNEPLSPAVRAAAMDAIGQLCPDGAGEALRRGWQDPDAMVKRAAKQALDKCHR